MASEREAGCCSDRETVGMQTARSILTGVQGVAWRADGGARRVPANGRRGSTGLSPSPGWRWEEPGRARSPSRNARESLSQTSQNKPQHGLRILGGAAPVVCESAPESPLPCAAPALFLAGGCPNTRSGDPQSFQTHKVLLTASRIPRAAGSGAGRSRTGPFRPTSHCRTINPTFPALLCLPRAACSRGARLSCQCDDTKPVEMEMSAAVRPTRSSGTVPAGALVCIRRHGQRSNVEARGMCRPQTTPKRHEAVACRAMPCHAMPI